MLHIHISSLRIGLQERSFTPEAKSLDLDPNIFSEIQVDARIDYHEHRILVRLETRAVAKLQCDRTLVMFDQSISGTHQVLYTTDALDPEQGDAPQEDVFPLASRDRTLDVTPLARDSLLLALPLRRIAPEAVDLDLKESFGKPEKDQIDPRWEALKGLSSHT